ncbi:hypothetical protein TorRG33x02_285870 [Trema orientale]|uniref:Uncharacterized protein n=1 Tax=Trema orientale TaxID=63057 RepID=A0A2P5CGC2_TREOI|nr:hypothetical protein TorRG33x02_285870 [Trema orientale]
MVELALHASNLLTELIASWDCCGQTPTRLSDDHKPSSSLNETLLEPIVDQASHYLKHGHVDQLHGSFHLAADFEVHFQIIVPGVSGPNSSSLALHPEFHAAASTWLVI